MAYADNKVFSHCLCYMTMTTFFMISHLNLRPADSVHINQEVHDVVVVLVFEVMSYIIVNLLVTFLYFRLVIDLTRLAMQVISLQITCMWKIA